MAAGLAAELEQAFGVRPRLVEGSGGVYQVRLDGRVIFDKRDAGRFPVLGEVSELIREARPESAN